MKVKLLLTAITLSCLAIDVLAQVSISGKIVSADTNEPIVGANIRIDQSLSGCTTNGKGEFSISNLPDGKHVLRITHVSYTPKSITTKGGEKNLLIKLQDSFTNIGQVVVTGTGTHHRMTDSPVPVSVITAKDLSNASVTSLDEALQKLTPSFSSMARYIEYKNKTQEKCNYCTIYQCISGFYKKNVELHLLLILAIDSVIYSFYVTILLCKKAPVFD